MSTKVDSTKIDESLYSRQLYVIGHDGMSRMMNSKILIIGIDGVGMETCKNLVLAGVRNISIYDPSSIEKEDLEACYYFSMEDIGSAKDKVALPHLRKLNRYVEINIPEDIDFSKYNIVVTHSQTLEDNVSINTLCRKYNTGFIMGNSCGVFGQVFVDLISHVVLDMDGSSTETGSISMVTEDGILILPGDTRSTLSDGDYIKIFPISREESQNPIFKDLYKVSIVNDEIRLDGYKCPRAVVGGDYEKQKIPVKISFRSLKETLEEPQKNEIFTFSNPELVEDLHALFNMDLEHNLKTEGLRDIFDSGKGRDIAPVCSVLGGYIAQETLKGITGNYVPLQQYYYFEALDLIRAGRRKNSQNIVYDSQERYSNLVSLIGKDSFESLANTNVFLVGAGAIGCEHMKNLVMSGICSKGKLIVTDMDDIEESNLNRQFLFERKDIGKPKSTSAAYQVKILNKEYTGEIETYREAVSGETESLFTDKLLGNVDVIMNALDNIEARSYMDTRAVKSRVCMIDAGTLGTKGHVQMVIPFVTESYNSTVEQIESSIPMCTIKSYPTRIEHAIEWALTIFEKKFNEEIVKIIKYKKDSKRPDDNLTHTTSSENIDIIENISEKKGEEAVLDEEYSPETLVKMAPMSSEECVEAAVSLFKNLFLTSIKTLLSKLPADCIGSNGIPFWSPPKRAPHPIDFNIEDPLHFIFVSSAANLYASAFRHEKVSDEMVRKYSSGISKSIADKKIENAQDPLPISFDKDTWHADFIYACSNLRARTYKIKEQTKHFIKGIAGKIVPAIATTTAVVSGLAVIEMMKYIISKKYGDFDIFRTVSENNREILDNMDREVDEISKYRSNQEIEPEKLRKYIENLCSKNVFLDLGVPFIGVVDVVSAKREKYSLENVEETYNLWDRRLFKNMPLKDLISTIQNTFKKNVEMISIGSKILFWNFGSGYEKNMSLKISELCEIAKDTFLVEIDVLFADDFESEAIMIII